MEDQPLTFNNFQQFLQFQQQQQDAVRQTAADASAEQTRLLRESLQQQQQDAAAAQALAQAAHDAQLKLLRDEMKQDRLDFAHAFDKIVQRKDTTDIKSPKEFPKIDSFAHSMGTDAGARADYLVAVSQINNRMELLGQYEAHRVWFKYRNSAAGKQAIADDAAAQYQNGQDIYPDQAAKDARYDFLRDRFKHDVKSVYEGTALRKLADVAVADPNGTSADPLRADAVPFAASEFLA